MEVPKVESSIPDAVLRRCVGKQTPVTPHAQRLLVASMKEAKMPQPGEAPGKLAAKAKAKSKASAKPKAPSKPKVSKPKATPAAKSGAAPKGEKTPYALAKDAYVAEFLVSSVCLDNPHLVFL